MRLVKRRFVFVLAIATQAIAQQTPNAVPGFRAEGIYEFSGLDQVSYFNGGLSIAGIPLGPPLQTSSHLKLQLVLSYSSSAWQAVPESCPPPGEPICGAILSPRPQDLAGLGWRVSIGELYQPPTAAGLPPNRWIYSDSTGSLHTLYPTLHPGDLDEDAGTSFEFQLLQPTTYSRDGSYIRTLCDRPTSTTYGDCWVEIGGTGERRHFDNVGTATSPTYRIDAITDRFGNAIQIDYDATHWYITDTHTAQEPEREIVLTFTSTGIPDQPLLLDFIDFPCFSSTPGANCDGTGSPTARWDFEQEPKSDVFPPSVYGSSPTMRSVQVLTMLTLPNGTSYSTSTSGYDSNQGKLKSLTLPTLGKLEWVWSEFEFPAVRENGEDCQEPLPPTAMYWTSTHGVTQRRERDRDGSLLGTWKYSRLACPNPENPTSCPGDEQGVNPDTTTGEKLTVRVDSPLNDVSEYFFSIYSGENGSCVEDLWGTGIWEYGMPYTRKVADPTDGSRLLSEKHWDCPLGVADPDLSTCTLQRTVYKSMGFDSAGNLGWNGGEVNDRNRRLRSQRTVFNTDGDRWKLVEHSDFDGFGHFRTTLESSDFLPDHDRTVTTNFNPAAGTYPGTWTQFSPSSPWILETFDWRGVRETGIDQCNKGNGQVDQFAWEEFCFDESTGFLERQRSLRTSADAPFPVLTNLPRTSTDVIRVFEQDPSLLDGNVAFEGWYGGDDGPALATGPLCQIVSLPAPDFRQLHDYQFGIRRRTRFTDGDSNPGNDAAELQHWLLNAQVDGRTGLIRSSADVADVAANYRWDTTNRLVASLPSDSNGPPAECLSYSNATAGSRAAVSRSSYGGTTCGGTELAAGEYQYDGLGRLAQERRKISSAPSFHDRFLGYDAAGHRNFVSEWTQGESETNARKYGRESRGYDPFGRPTEIRHNFLVGGSPQVETEATFGYLGEREVQRTRSIASVLSGGSVVTEPVTFIERYDDNGRLSQVIERSSPAGSQINTYYSYDVAGRLKRVETDPSGTSSDQVRCWEYDQRGFLLAEEHPEIEGATDPTEEDPEPPQVDDVLFSDYDAMGHAKRSQQGVDPAPEEHEAAYLRFEFDAAARLRKVFDLQVEPGAGDDRLMKEWQFATANSGSNRKKGKVEFAFGYNYPVLSGGNPTILLRETFVYGENAGQLSQRTLDAFFNGSQQHRFVHSEQVDALGQRTRISEPVCVEPTGTPGFCAPSSLVALDVDSTYSYGLLTGMPSWLSSLAYHPNGLWSSITHANGLVETATLGADRRARPKLLTSTVGGNTLWKSGTYLYDPSGNIFGIGSTAAGAEPNEIGGVDRYLYDRAERLKHAWVTVPEAIPPTCDVFCDDFETGDVCAWDAAEPPQCGGLGGGESPAAIRVDEREYLFDLHGNIGQTNLWEGGVAQPPRVTTTVPSTNRLAGPLGDYDSRGNLTGYSTTSFTFDRLNRLIGRSVSGEPVYHFLYTADDERTLTLLDNASNQRWTMRDFGGKVLRTFVSSPSGVGLSKTYVHRGESLVAAIDNEADDVPVTSHYSTDHLGTPRLETAMSGALNQKWKYFPFGEEAVPASQEGTLLRFTGHERDIFNPGGPADDHDYMHARYFSPTTARFLSTDPVGGNPKAPQSWNRYAYVRGNPLRFIDPSGMAARRFSLLGGEINVSIDDAVEGKRQAILFERIHQALGGINSAQVNLTKSEISTIKNISSISVNPNASRAFVTESTGEQTFTPDYVETASTAFLGSAIAHDGFHVRLFWQGGLDASRGLEAERQAFTFQIEVGQKIGLSPEEIDYIKDFRDDEKLLKSYILQDPLGNKP